MIVNSLFDGLGSTRAAAGVWSFAAEYAERAFVGREMELAALDSWRDGDERTLLVIAPAGRGKSALLYRWALAQRRVVWVPVSQRFSTARSADVRQLLASRLEALGCGTAGDWVEQSSSSEEPLLILIDGLDELLDAGLEDDLRAALELSDVRIVVAARELIDRDAAAWATHLGWTPEAIELGGLDRLAIQELMPEAPTAVLSEVMRITNGDPLTSMLLAEAVNRGEPLSLERASPGLDGVLEAWWATNPSTDAQSAVLRVFARAAGPVPETLVARVGGFDDSLVRETFESVARLIVRDGEGHLSFAHPRLGYHFSDALSAEDLAAIDEAWVAQTTAVFDLLIANEPVDVGAGYVVTSHRVHLERSAHPLEALLRLVDIRWLDAWERVEGGTAGFLSDLLAIWARVDAEAERDPSSHLSAVQMKLSAIATLVTTSERTLSAPARAEAVRLGVRSQRAAVESVSTIADSWQHRTAVASLLEVVDDRGVDLLLAAAGTPNESGWPIAEIVERLLRRGAPREALQWALAPSSYPGGRIRQIAKVFAQFGEEERAVLRETMRGDLDPDAEVEHLALVASVLDGHERVEMLVRAKGVLDALGDDQIYWDEGDRDPRLLLAEAFSDAGEADVAIELLQRAWQNPYPYSESDAVRPGPEILATWARCAQVPSNLLDEAHDDILFEANIENAASLSAAAPLLAPYDRDALAARLSRATGKETHALHQAIESGDPALAVPAVRRIVELVDACAATPDDYAAAYPLYSHGLSALSRGASFLPEPESLAAAKTVWRIAQILPTPITWWDVVQALLSLLARCSGPERDHIAEQLLGLASEQLDLTPPLCEFTAWRDVYTLAQQRRYVRGLATKRTLARPSDHVETLASFATHCPELPRRRIAGAAMRLAMNQGAINSLTKVVAVDPSRWDEITAYLLDPGNHGIGPWTLSHLLENAPSDDERGRVARYAWTRGFDAKRMGCTGDLLAALPTEEAEAIADRLIDADSLAMVGFHVLPPRALQRALEVAIDKAKAEGWAARANLVARTRQVADHPVLAGEDKTIYQWLAARLPDAPDESAMENPTDEIWEVAGSLARIVDGELLELLHEAALDRGPTKVLTSMNHRRVTLGQGDRIRWRNHEKLTPFEQFRAALYSATDGETLRSALALHPKALTYPWVCKFVREKGLSHAFTTIASTSDDPSERLVAWDGVWEDLTPTQREALFPSVLTSIDEDHRKDGHGRQHWLERLSADLVRSQWCLEIQGQRKRRNFAILAHFAPAMGCAAEHAEAFIEALAWFDEGILAA